MIRGPPRSTLDRSSAASDVYKRQVLILGEDEAGDRPQAERLPGAAQQARGAGVGLEAVSYTHLRAHETVLDRVCRLLLETNKLRAALYPLPLRHLAQPTRP